jgi:hypothetical protein
MAMPPRPQAVVVSACRRVMLDARAGPVVERLAQAPLTPRWVCHGGRPGGASLRRFILRERAGRLKGSLAPLAACAPLTRPARSRATGQLPERRGLEPSRRIEAL